MANTILTHQMIAREAAKMLTEESPFIANINKGRQDEFGVDVQDYKRAIQWESRSLLLVVFIMGQFMLKVVLVLMYWSKKFH